MIVQLWRSNSQKTTKKQKQTTNLCGSTLHGVPHVSVQKGGADDFIGSSLVPRWGLGRGRGSAASQDCPCVEKKTVLFFTLVR